MKKNTRSSTSKKTPIKTASINDPHKILGNVKPAAIVAKIDPSIAGLQGRNG